MFDHTFKVIPHYCIGPLRNTYGYILAVAEIGEVWMIRLETPEGIPYSAYFATHDDVINAINTLNGAGGGS